MGKEIQKRGQVTIFIIVAIILVSVILIFLFWVKPTYFANGTGQFGFQGCVKNVVAQSINELGSRAGFISPQFTYKYNSEEFTYLCYTNKYYKTCTVQVPFLKDIFEGQMKKLIKDKIDSCYSNSIDELKSQGYSVKSGNLEYNVSIRPGVVDVNINAPTVVGSHSLNTFDIRVNSNIYRMIGIARYIVQSETRYGDTDSEKLMLFYPNYIISKLKMDDGTTLYTISDKTTKNKFQFASRSLAWPAGYDIK